MDASQRQSLSQRSSYLEQHDSWLCCDVPGISHWRQIYTVGDWHFCTSTRRLNNRRYILFGRCDAQGCD